MKLRLGPGAAKRLDAAHEKYVTALRDWNTLRCQRGLANGCEDYTAYMRAAHRRAKEAFAEWSTLFEHETGRKLRVDAT